MGVGCGGVAVGAGDVGVGVGTLVAVAPGTGVAAAVGGLVAVGAGWVGVAVGALVQEASTMLSRATNVTTRMVNFFKSVPPSILCAAAFACSLRSHGRSPMFSSKLADKSCRNCDKYDNRLGTKSQSVQVSQRYSCTCGRVIHN